MSVHASFDNATPADPTAEMPPVVLRFSRLKPKQLSRFKMHDRRSGGDLNHVDLTKKSLNQIEHGENNWILKLTRRIERMAKRNLKNEVRALKEKGRFAEAERRQAEGPKSPWHANTDAPLREGILTVIKSWFGGSGVEEWDQDKVEDFREYAMAFLHTHFPDGQLLYAASHSDEEAFHIHFVTSTWDSKITANRGKQIQLRAAANPILKRYEYAQDLAGEYFEQIGITRGERRAKARRQAKAEGNLVPEKRHHIPPSEYREQERNKGKVAAEKLKRAAVEDCTIAMKKTRKRVSRSEHAARRKTYKAEARMASVQADVAVATDKLKTTKVECQKAETARNAADETAKLILNDAQETADRTIRKSRERSIKEAGERKAETERQLRAAQEKRMIEEQAAENARKAASTALAKEQRALACVTTLNSKAVEVNEDLNAARAEHKTVIGEISQAEIRLESVLRNVGKAKITEADAIKRRDLRLKEVAEAKEGAFEAETRKVALNRQMDALTEGLELIAEGLITYCPALETKDERLAFTKSAPSDQRDRKKIITCIWPAVKLLTRIGALVRKTVNAVLARERARIVQDVQVLDDIRKEMGIEENERLDDLKARYDNGREEPGPSGV